ncbi:hypothetical protein J2Y55_004173 [Bosea sp. BE125]|uniref:transglycosylase SLT domain-containing protein n=1 Tax=Bosea sp. BE125 TaxID=2817909 RepID=UPI0028544467|nr:transglycosylase SLT domain-containing protein [Bosea sp. BE125]MDR6873149.1 hypothetical protein [Bosea sp. BE125]
MTRRPWLAPGLRLPGLMLALLLGGSPILAQEPPSSGIDAALCRLIDDAATAQAVPAGFLTRLIFQESSFRPAVTSSAGAQGVAQFMPGTARERGLTDPFDPEQAVPKAAHFLSDLRQRFGNWGLAAAAYNGGPTRVSSWIAGRGFLPTETENYVLSITGATAEAWAEDARAGTEGETRPARPASPDGQAPCLTTVALIRAGRGALAVAEAPFAPWGVQLAANFSKARALSAFQRASARHRAILADLSPMVIGTRLRSRGTRAFYRVRLPAATRAQATALCRRIQDNRGACVVLKS